MKKLTEYLFIALLVSLLAPVTLAYDPDDLRRFRETNRCVRCDLRDADFNSHPFFIKYSWIFFKERYKNFEGANLRGANLRGANLGGVNLGYANLKGANLYRANLAGAKLYLANLENANLQKAVLIQTMFGGANLENANLQETEFYWNNFRDAKLVNTIFSKSEFTKLWSQKRYYKPRILKVKFPVETIAVERSGYGYWNQFRGLSGKAYEITVDNVDRQADVAIRLYDSRSKLLKTIDEHFHGKSEKIVWTAPRWNSDQDYYVNIQGTHLDENYLDEKSYKLQVYERFSGDEDIPITSSSSTFEGNKPPGEPISDLNNWLILNDEPLLEDTSLEMLLKRANEYKELGKYRKALKLYKKALPLVQELDDSNQKGSTLNLIGEMHHKLGESKDALEIYEQVLIIYEEIDEKSLVGKTLIDIGAVYSHLYQHEKALAYYQRSWLLSQQAKNPGGEGLALNEMGNAFYNMGQSQQALTHYQHALKLFQNTPYRHNEGVVFLNLGKTYLALKQHPKALQSYQQAQTLYQTIEAVYGEALAFCGRGRVHSVLGQYEEALPLFQYCLDILEGFDALDNLWLVQAQLGFVEAQLNKHQKAVRHYRQALDSIESLRTTLTSEASKLLFIQDKYSVYDEFIQLLQSLHQKYPTQDYNYESLKVFEKKQGRIFVEKIAKSGARRFANLPIEKSEKERELEDQLAKIRADLIKKSPELTNEQRPEEISALIERFNKLKTEQQQFRETLADEFFGYYTLKYPQPATLAALQNGVLQEGELLLIYGVMETKTILWVVGKGYFEMFTLSGEAALKKQVDAFLNAINAMQQAVKDAGQMRFNNKDLQDWLEQNHGDTLPELVQTSHLLYQALLPAKVRKRLAQAQRVYIVPTGPLYGLPFEALVTTSVKKNETPHYLIQDVAMAYLSSASLLKTLRDVQARRKHKASQPLLAFANPDFPPCVEQNIQKRSAETDDFIGIRTLTYQKLVDGCFRRLPETEQEVKEIADFLNVPHDTALKLGDAATRETVLNSKLDDYRHLVFSTHAVLPQETNGIAQPALVLSHKHPNDEDAYLTMTDVLSLKLNADFVTLSACNTGQGEQIKGEGVRGLTRAFMYAGTPAVSVTLWAVESQSAKSLSTGTFKYWAENPPNPRLPNGKTQTEKVSEGRTQKRTLAEALRTIKLDMLSNKDKKYEHHPYFWAPFVIWGDGAAK